MTIRAKSLYSSIVQIFVWFSNVIRYAGTQPPYLDHLTDEMERAITGDRCDNPLHRQRTLLLRR